MAYDVTKLTKLSQLKLLAEKIKADYATKASVSNLETRINDIVATGGEPNTINKILVNGVEQAITNKAVDVTVPTKVSDLNNDSKYQTDTEVNTAIQAAIAATGHASFVKVDAVPAADTAQDNVLYLVMNSDTKHYDIYAKVGTEVVLIDDTTVDLSGYSSTEEMNAAINAAITGLNISQYATNGRVDGINETMTQTFATINGTLTDQGNAITTAEGKIEALEAVGATKVEASSVNGNVKINGVETTVYTEPADVVHGAIATDNEVAEMLNEVFAA